MALDYSKIASDAIAVVSVAIAVYLTAVTLLIGSRVAEYMRKQDARIPTKTQLGVLISYLSHAVVTGILSIVVSCAVLLEKVPSGEPSIVRSTLSAFGFSFFTTTLLFIALIFWFMENALLTDGRLPK